MDLFIALAIGGPLHLRNHEERSSGSRSGRALRYGKVLALCLGEGLDSFKFLAFKHELIAAAGFL